MVYSWIIFYAALGLLLSLALYLILRKRLNQDEGDNIILTNDITPTRAEEIDLTKGVVINYEEDTVTNPKISSEKLIIKHTKHNTNRLI